MVALRLDSLASTFRDLGPPFGQILDPPLPLTIVTYWVSMDLRSEDVQGRFGSK